MNRCSCCHALAPPDLLAIDSSFPVGADGADWRWTGSAWEHKCPGIHPQCGHMPVEPVSEERPDA